MKSVSKLQSILVIAVIVINISSFGLKKVQSKTEDTFQVSMSSPYVFQNVSLVFEIPIKTSIKEDDWLTLVFPDVLPVPQSYNKEDEYGNEYSAEIDLRKNIQVNFLSLDPNKSLPIINYAENSLSFVMPRTLQIRPGKTTWLWITMYYTLPQKPCEGLFQFWHSSLDRPFISNKVSIIDTTIKQGLKDISMVLSDPICNEPTSWQFTCKTNERLVLYKNRDVIQINFGKIVDFPAFLQPSLVTVNDIPAYAVTQSGDSLIILLPTTIHENQPMKVIIWKEFGLKSPRTSGNKTIIFIHSIMMWSNSQYTKPEYPLSVDIRPGKPYVTLSNPLTEEKSTYTLNWNWNPPYGSDTTTLQIRWPENFPLKESQTVYASFNGEMEKSGIYQNGIISFSLKNEFETNQSISMKISQVKTYEKEYFINPSPRKLQFAIRYHPSLDWIDFEPADILPGKILVNHLEWENRYAGQPVETSLYFALNDEMNSICAEGFYLTFSENMVLPTEIHDNSIYFHRLSSSLKTVYSVINAQTLFIKTENKEDATYNRFEWSLHISNKSGIVNPASPAEKISFSIQSKMSESPDFQAEFPIVQIKDIPVISLEGGKLGTNDWFISPPTLTIKDGEVGSYIRLGSILYELPMHDIPLLEGQNIQYFSLTTDFPHEGPFRSTYIKLKVDTIPVAIHLEKPALSWSLTNSNKYIIKGNVFIPFTIDYNGNLKIIDQSLKIQNRMVLIKADGSFEDLVTLQKGKNTILFELIDWAGHQLTKIINIYLGKGVILQIGSKNAWIPDKTITIDAPPVISQNRTFVPIRFIAEAFGATVTYRPNTKPPSVLIQRNNQQIVFFTGSKSAKIDGKPYPLEVAPFIQQNRTMVPLRFLADIWKMETNWEATESVIAILFSS